MDNQRVQVEAFAGGAEQLDLSRIGHAGPPHTGAGGEDLKGVGAQIRSGECRRFERAGRKSVYAEAQGPMLTDPARTNAYGAGT